jgi:hypothetical protein
VLNVILSTLILQFWCYINRVKQKQKAMLEYAKIILPKVSFSRELFRKELRKCIGWVEQNQLQKLSDWCFNNFKELYPDILIEEFSQVAA